MNLHTIIPVYASIKLDEQGFMDLHMQVLTGSPLYVQCQDDSELYIMVSDDGTHHLWHFTYKPRYVGEDAHFGLVTIQSISVTQNLSQAFDSLNQFLKAKFTPNTDADGIPL